MDLGMLYFNQLTGHRNSGIKNKDAVGLAGDPFDLENIEERLET